MQIKGYFLTAYESKYVTSALFADSFLDILKANINGINVFEGGPLYFLTVKLFIKIFGNASEFVVRLPSVIISFITILLFYAFTKKCINNKYFSVISLLVFCLNISFLTFSSVSIPQIMASDFAFISVLFACYPLFSQNTSNKHLFFIGFWFFMFLVVFTDLFTAIVPFLIVIFSYLILKKFFDLVKPVNFILGIFSAFLIVYNLPVLSYKVSENIPLFDYLLNSGNGPISFHVCLKYITGLFAGLMPWTILFIAIVGLFIAMSIKLLKNLIFNELSDEGRLLLISANGFFISSLVFFLNHSFANVILAVSFASVCIGYIWYKYIFHDEYKAIINFSSAFLFGITLLFAVSIIIIFFFIDNSLKIYLEPLLCPLIIITLLVSIPGLIVVVLDKKLMNFSAHILFSVVFYFILTNVLFDYLNSFGESELITYSYRARDNVSKLATYDLKNKYVIPYYFGDVVEFNEKITNDELFQKYGETYDIRIIMRIKSLEDLDKHFVYELLDSGKDYCVITNIKMLPSDLKKEIKANS